MAFLRLVFGLMLVAAVLCFAIYIGTRRPVWRQRGLALIKWALIAAAGFFAVLTLERLGFLP
jgi:hypothetical protein